MKTLTEIFKEITVKKGECFALDLEFNASTGFEWNCEVTKGSVSIVSHDLRSSHTQAGMIIPGGTAIDHTVFRADESGDIELQARYARVWENGKPPAKSCIFKITVS